MKPTRRSVMAGALAFPFAGAGRAKGLSVPVIDTLTLTVLADGTVSSFFETVERPGMRLSASVRGLAGHQRTLRAEFGYAVLAETAAAQSRARILVDFGYTPETLANNMALLGLDPASFDAMVLSHGHYDHFGGMPAVLGKVRRGTRLYVGGEEAFCERLRGVAPATSSFGRIDRAALAVAGIDMRVSTEPSIVGGAGFTTGRIAFRSPERPKVPTTMLPGLGCRRDLLDSDRRDAQAFVDDAVHELGTAFHLKNCGLVVIGSCSHRGIVNTVLAAQAASGVSQVHAIVGGFHLVTPQNRADAIAAVGMIEALKPSFVLPGHCSGENFITLAMEGMAGRVFRSVVGSRIEFG